MTFNLVNPTAPYDPEAPLYQNLPKGANIAAFAPGFQDALTRQMSAAYGQGNPQEMNPDAYRKHLEDAFSDVIYTQLKEPLTQSYSAWGIEPEVNDKEYKLKLAAGGFNPEGYQQHGLTTGSPYLDGVFGLAAEIGGAGRTPTTPPVNSGGQEASSGDPYANTGRSDGYDAPGGPSGPDGYGLYSNHYAGTGMYNAPDRSVTGFYSSQNSPGSYGGGGAAGK